MNKGQEKNNVQNRYRLLMQFLPFATSLLLAAAFFKYNLGWFVFIGLLPILFFIEYAKTKPLSRRKIILLLWLAGLLFYLLINLWFLFIKPSSWAAIEGVAAVIGVVFSWLYTSFTYSIGFLLFAFLVVALPYSRPDKLVSVFYLPAAWIIGEFMRSVFFSLMAWGSQATLGAHWNFGNLGFGVATTPLASISRWMGLYGISFIAICINIVLYWILKRSYKRAVIAFLVIASLAVVGYWPRLETNGSINIGLVQLEQYGTAYSQPLLHRVTEVGKLPASNPSLLIFPEESLYSKLYGPNQSIIADQAFEPTGDGYIINTEFETTNDGQTYPTIQLRDRSGEIIESQRKTFLIPIGEYMPKALEILLIITANPQEIQRYQELRAHSKGNQPVHPFVVGEVKVGALPCSGVITPSSYRDLSKQGAQILVNSAALDIFSHSNQYFEQTKQMARFQAVANGKPFAQATLGGYSYVIDPYGRFLLETKQIGLNYQTTTIKPVSTKTPYVRYGEWILPISILVILASSITSYWNTLKRNNFNKV